MKTKSSSLPPPHALNASGWLRMSQLPFGETLCRTLIKEGKLESVVVSAKPGGKQGIRLVSQESLNQFLRSLPR